MLCLAEVWPRSLLFTDLVASARERLAANGVSLSDESMDAQVLGVNILRAFGYSSSLIELHTFSTALTNRVDERPDCQPGRSLSGAG